ncbi:tape measure protein [Anaerosinus massiliensis]|uniref:tape measure protein n=1 Tax=Massilibacillus massiliensis TaxID=1806837 RepID=UPI000DA5FA01|nr:tape measure protein [Massilibacillus massiliensis]
MANNNEIKVHITAENEQFVSKLQEVVSAIKGAKKSSTEGTQAVGGFLSKIANFGMILTGVYAGLSMLKTGLDSTVGSIGKYSMSMENNEASFEVFLGNSQLATQYLNDLKKIAADTPFDMPGVTDAGKKLLAFGFDAETSLKMLRSIGDASAGLGLGTEGIQRITLALGQIKAKGRVMGDELLQLTEAGIPAYTILADKLGLTADQVKNIGDAGIDADTAINALLTGMDEKFGGLSTKLADKMMGLLSTIQDNAMNTGSFVLSPLFESLEKGLVKVRDFSDQLSAAINGQGNIDENVGVLRVIVKIQTGLEEAKDSFISFTELFGAYDDDGSFYFSEEALSAIENAGDLLERAWNLALDIGDALVNTSPVVGEIISRVGEWLETLINIVDIIVNAINPGVGDVNESFAGTNTIIDIVVDTLMGFFILEKIITMIQGMQTAFNLVKTAVIGVREAVKATSIAQAALNVLTGAMGGPAGIAMALGASAAAVGAGYALEKSGIFDFGSLKGSSPDDEKSENKLQQLLDKLREQQSNRQQYQPGTRQQTQNSQSEEATKESQKELKSIIRSISDWVKAANKDIDDQIETLKLKNEQSPMNPQDFYNQLYSLEQQKSINTEMAIQEKINATNNALFKDEADRSASIKKYQADAEEAAKATGKLSDALNEITGTMQTAQTAFNKEGTTWRREVDDVNIEGLNEVALNAISAVSQKFFELTGRQMVVSSGLRNWGGHVNGNKFDVVDDYSSILLESNSNGIRDAIIDYARSIGLDVLDEYSDPSARATAGHLDFDASSFTGQLNQYMTWQAGDMLTKGGAEYRKSLQALFDEGNKLLIQSVGLVDEQSQLDKAEINSKYNKLAEKFRAANLNHVVEAIEKIRFSELLDIDFKETQKKLEYANNDLTESQEVLLSQLASGAISATEVTESYIEKFHTLMDKNLAELKTELEQAISIGDKETIASIKAKIKEVTETLKNGINEILDKIQDNMDWQTKMIDVNSTMTSRQKENAKKNVDADGARQNVAALDARLNGLWSEYDKLKIWEKGDFFNKNIMPIEQQRRYNQELAKVPSLLDDIHTSSKQALEDGLVTFLTDGINEAENLKEAFLDLVESILKSIQQVFAKKITDDLMNQWFEPTENMYSMGESQPKNRDGALGFNTDFAPQYATQTQELDSKLNSISSNFSSFVNEFNTTGNYFLSRTQTFFNSVIQTMQSAANAIPIGSSVDTAGSTSSGGTSNFEYKSQYFSGGGSVVGPGTGTSDSIFAKLSNGEFVVKADAVKKVGTRFLERVNNGDIHNLHFSLPKFAKGGYVGRAGSQGMSNAMESFTANLSTGMSPRLNVNNYVDGQRVFDTFGRSLIKSEVRKEHIENAKFYSQINKRMK